MDVPFPGFCLGDGAAAARVSKDKRANNPCMGGIDSQEEFVGKEKGGNEQRERSMWMFIHPGSSPDILPGALAGLLIITVMFDVATWLLGPKVKAKI